ncbi:MAG: transporter substrate-binding domain-containing protein, partial [Synergistaceae bacterium]|nr:transporter substrate-binding domain-containing protein [Synergistaceae bacterium]
MHRKILLLLLLLALLPINKIYASVNSIYELNDPKYTLGVSDKGAAFDAVKRDFPRAKLAYYDGVDGFMAVKTSKIDAYINDRITMILALQNGFEGVKILPGSVGEPIKIAVGISRKSKIPNLRKKINEFIAILNSDGTLEDMYKRWVFDSNYTMPEINTTSSPKFKLVVGTVGMIPPYSFYEGNKLTGHDIEFVKRFAAWLGADVVFKDYDFAGVVAAAVTGNIDIVAANLQISSERAEKIDFSDIIMSSDFSVMVRDDSPKKVDSHNSIKYLNGKNIGIQTGNPEWDKIIKQILPASKIFYYNTFTDLLTALKAHRIDSFPGDEANLKFIAEEDKSVMILDEDITETYGLSFAFTKTDLRDKFNDFMKEIKADGRLNSITAKWTTESGNKIAVDYESLPSTNGTLTFATEGEYPPFNYVLNGKIAGMEIDLAYEFCKLYGYGLNVLTMNYEAIPAAITSNKADFSANLTIDDEHKEALIFSVPYYYCATKLMVLKPSDSSSSLPANNSGYYTNLQDFNGKRIGVITGSIHPEIVLPVLPDAELFYFNTKADEVAALVSGKIDAFLCSEPEAISLMSENNNLSYMNTRLSHFNLAYCTAKNSKGAALAEELSKFIRELENNGTLSKLRDKWFRSSDESQKPLEDYSQLPAKNGVIRFAQFAHGVPFTYLRDNIIVGYEVEILVKFCKEKGYGLEVITMDFGGILPAVMSGKCDVAGGGIIITPERSEQVNFTEPIYHSGTVLMTLKSNLADDNKLAQKISDFNGKRIGVITGSITPEIVKSTLPASERFYFDSPSDEIAALLANKIDAFVYSRIEANTMIAASENDNLSYLNEPLSSFELAFCTAKTPKGKALADELNEFLRRIDNDGTLKILRDKWLTDSKSQKTLDEDYSQLPAKNGVIKFAQTGIFPPFSYVSNGKTVGYDIEIIAKFCKEKGYGLEIFTMNFAGILAGIDSGRFDMGGGGLIITPERAEKVNFTLPNYKGDFVIVAMKSDSAGDNKFIANLDDLDGKRIGALTGSIFPELIKSRLPSANIFYFSSRADEAAALTAGKIDAF